MDTLKKAKRFSETHPSAGLGLHPMGKTRPTCENLGMSEYQTSKVAIVGNYPPRKCGIATFTSDLRSALEGMENGWPCPVVAVISSPTST